MAGTVGRVGTTRIGLQGTLGLALAKGKTITASSRSPETGETGRPGVIGTIGTTDHRLQLRGRQWRIEKPESGSSSGGRSSIEVM
ncbi:MAG TPA: hypothetical protein DIC23_04905, partial [Planctomycetaceae bacterium]|nr:hypothetical protein [Planctomycetaceae bacterium]